MRGYGGRHSRMVEMNSVCCQFHTVPTPSLHNILNLRLHVVLVVMCCCVEWYKMKLEPHEKSGLSVPRVDPFKWDSLEETHCQ